MQFNNLKIPDKKRYIKVSKFIILILFKTLLWDIILNRPIFRIIRTPPLPRWQKAARQFHNLAAEMGGVLIKLGQFLSIRVDILPVEITSELAGLQDKVPPERAEDIIATIENEFSCSIDKKFSWFSGNPAGAASLAQVHKAQLFSGETVMVKVLRPNIENIVKTDLAAIKMAFNCLKLYKTISEKVDLDWLYKEFSQTTLKELDLINEGKNADAFAKNFSDDSYVYVPEIYWQYCSKKILTMENVSYIKIDDIISLDKAGISRTDLADKLYNAYMKQVFETWFVHVDPHPGNLFVCPLPTSEEKNRGIEKFPPEYLPSFEPERPFQIVFVDFGMTTHIHTRLRKALREYVIGLGTKDAQKIVQSYIHAGALLKGADIDALERAHKELFEKLWGINVGKIKNVLIKEAKSFLKEYRELIRNTPFQFQADMLFVVRAIGILSGMAAKLDPDFDLWNKTMPYAKKYAKQALGKENIIYLKKIYELSKIIQTMPFKADELMDMALKGNIRIKASVLQDSEKNPEKLNNSIRHAARMILVSGLLVSGAIFSLSRPLSNIWKIMVGLAAFLIFIDIIKKR